jgi:hypothetical protein
VKDQVKVVEKRQAKDWEKQEEGMEGMMEKGKE